MRLKTLVLATLLLFCGQQIAFSQEPTTENTKHACCPDCTVEDHDTPYHKVVKEGGRMMLAVTRFH